MGRNSLVGYWVFSLRTATSCSIRWVYAPLNTCVIASLTHSILTLMLKMCLLTWIIVCYCNVITARLQEDSRDPVRRPRHDPSCTIYAIRYSHNVLMCLNRLHVFIRNVCNEVHTTHILSDILPIHVIKIYPRYMIMSCNCWIIGTHCRLVYGITRWLRSYYAVRFEL